MYYDFASLHENEKRAVEKLPKYTTLLAGHTTPRLRRNADPFLQDYLCYKLERQRNPKPWESVERTKRYVGGRRVRTPVGRSRWQAMRDRLSRARDAKSEQHRMRAEDRSQYYINLSSL